MVLYIEEFYTRPPKPRDPEDHEEEEEEDGGEDVSWIFLFVDLVYVALVSKLSHVMEFCALSVHTFVFVLTVMTVSFVTRLTIDDYACRFVNNDLFHRLCYFVYTMCNFIMTLNVNTIDTAEEGKPQTDAACQANFYSFGFSVGFCISRLVIVTLLAAVIWEDQQEQIPPGADADHEEVAHVKSEELKEVTSRKPRNHVRKSWDKGLSQEVRDKLYKRFPTYNGLTLPLREQMRLLYNENVSRVSVLYCVTSLIFGLIGNKDPIWRRKDGVPAMYHFNSAFKQFGYTIVKLCLSSSLIMLLLGVEYYPKVRPGDHSLLPSNYKMFMYVAAMCVEIGGYFYHYLAHDFDKVPRPKRHHHHHHHHQHRHQSRGREAEGEEEEEDEGGAVREYDSFSHKDKFFSVDPNEFEGQAGGLELRSVKTTATGEEGPGAGASSKAVQEEHIPPPPCCCWSCCCCFGKQQLGGKDEKNEKVIEEKDICEDEYYPLRVVSYQERLGAFIMLMMGEAVIVLLLPYYQVATAKSAYFFSICACWLLFIYGIQYYDAQNFKKESYPEDELQDELEGHKHSDGKPLREHAMNHSALSRFLYVWLHLVLAICVFFTSCSIGLLYHEAMSEELGGHGAGAATETGAGGEEVPSFAPTHTPGHMAALFSSSLSSSSSSSSSFLRGHWQKQGQEQGLGLGLGMGMGMGRWLSGGGGGDSAAAAEQGAETDDLQLRANSWDHKSLVKPKVMLSTSVTMYVIVVTLIRSLHSGLEGLFSPKKTGGNPNLQDNRGIVSWMDEKTGGFSRLINKLLKMSYALLHLTAGWWNMKTPARYVGAHCALLTCMTMWELYLRFQKHTRVLKIKSKLHKKKYAAIKVTVNTSTNHLLVQTRGKVKSIHLDHIYGNNAASSSSSSSSRQRPGSITETAGARGFFSSGGNPLHHRGSSPRLSATRLSVNGGEGGPARRVSLSAVVAPEEPDL